MSEQRNSISLAFLNWADAIKSVTESLREIAEVIAGHREQWLCEGEGQWPDKFALLNRYVRTDHEPPYIFNE